MEEITLLKPTSQIYLPCNKQHYITLKHNLSWVLVVLGSYIIVWPLKDKLASRVPGTSYSLRDIDQKNKYLPQMIYSSPTTVIA